MKGILPGPVTLGIQSGGIAVVKFKTVDVYDYEGVKWYRILVRNKEVYKWIESNDDELWWEQAPDWSHVNKFLLYTVHEKLYTYICLKWSQ